MDEVSPVRGSRAKSVALYALCAALPVCVLALVLAACGVYPFGAVSPLREDFDIAYQYANILAWLQNVFAGEANLFYSFGKSLGGNMFPTFTYYAASPLNLLLPLFGDGHIDDFVFVTRLLRTGLCALAFAFFFRNRFGGMGEDGRGISADRGTTLSFSVLTAVFSLSYALMQYNVIQATNIMWLDAPILLPLVALGVYRFVRQRKFVLFIVALSVTIISCWYTGYMVVLASLVLFLLEYALMLSQRDERFEWKRFLGLALRFGLALLFVALATMVILLPSVSGLLTGKATEIGTSSAVVRYYPWEIIPAFFTLCFTPNWAGPQLFCGTLTSMGLLLLFFTKQITRTDKIIFAVVLVVLGCCTELSALERVWTGFTDGNNYYLRWGFVIQFVMLFAAAFVFTRWSPNRKDTLRVALLFLLVAIVALAVGGFNPLGTYAEASGLTRGVCFAVCVAIILVLTACLLLARKKEHRGGRGTGYLITAFLVAIVCFDMGINAYAIVSYDYVYSRPSYDRVDYQTYFDEEGSSLESIKESDTGLYRVDKLYTSLQDPTRGSVPTSESLALGYMPLSSYLSTNDAHVTKFMGNMGYTTPPKDGHSVFQGNYSDAILPSDALLGLKYVASSHAVQGYEATGSSAGIAGHEWYANDYAFPLAFAVGDTATGKIADGGGSSFDYQNSLFTNLFGESATVYTISEATETSRTEEGISWALPADGSIGSEGSFIEITTDEAYAKRFYSGFDLLMNGTPVSGKYLWCFSDGIVSAGGLTEGQTIMLLGSELQTDDTIACHVARVDTTALSSLQQQARAKAFTCDVWRDGYVSGSYSAGAEDAYLFTSIPYDAGWTVKVNGEDVVPETVADALMAIPLTEGDNAIEMSYLSPGVKTGGVISAVAWAAFVVFLIVRRVRAKSVR